MIRSQVEGDLHEEVYLLKDILQSKMGITQRRNFVF
jgi:hypothetical protein